MKPNLFLIHGWNMPPVTLIPLAQSLADRFRVTLATLPGYPAVATAEHPTLATPVEQCSLPIEISSGKSTQQLTAAVIRQAPDNAHWVGWSLGATVALAALEEAQSIASLSLVSPTPRFTSALDWEHGFSKATFEKLLRLTIKRHTIGTRQFLKLAAPTLPKETTANIAAQIEQACPSDAGLRLGFEYLVETDLRQRLSSIVQPAQVITASKDNIIPPTASQFIVEHLPNATHALLGDHHLIPITHHRELAASIKTFIDRLPT